MNTDYGTPPAGKTITMYFDTKDVTDGASITMTGFTVGDIKVFKDDSASTRGSTTGYALIDTDGTDVGAITGTHAFSINTGDGTVSGYWAIGSYYHVVISTITVDGVTVSGTVGHFRLGPPETIVGYQPVDAKVWAGDRLKIPTIPGVPEVNLKHWLNGDVPIPHAVGVPTVDLDYILGRILQENSTTITDWGAK